jgi:hypothetical protein
LEHPANEKAATRAIIAIDMRTVSPKNSLDKNVSPPDGVVNAPNAKGPSNIRALHRQRKTIGRKSETSPDLAEIMTTDAT